MPEWAWAAILAFLFAFLFFILGPFLKRVARSLTGKVIASIRKTIGIEELGRKVTNLGDKTESISKEQARLRKRLDRLEKAGLSSGASSSESRDKKS